MSNEAFSVRVVAPHFVAGFIVTAAGKITRAAPILRWLMRHPGRDAVLACRRKGWSTEIRPMNQTPLPEASPS